MPDRFAVPDHYHAFDPPSASPLLPTKSVKARCSIDKKSYQHRNVVDKLGVRPGMRVAFDDEAWPLDADLQRDILARAVPGRAESGQIDIVLVCVDTRTDVRAKLADWRPRISAGGSIWLLTPKRGVDGYVKQEDLIPCGLQSGLVDNKICSVSDTVSAVRFVIRISDRAAHSNTQSQ